MMSIPLIKEEERHILRVLPILLEKDQRFQTEVYSILNKTFATKDNLERMLEEMRIAREETNKRFEAADKRFEQAQEEMRIAREETNKRFEEMHKEMHLGFEQQRKETRKLGMSIRTIGSRWGKETEVTIRKTLQELLLKKLEAKEVSEWKIKDKDCWA